MNTSYTVKGIKWNLDIMSDGDRVLTHGRLSIIEEKAPEGGFDSWTLYHGRTMVGWFHTANEAAHWVADARTNGQLETAIRNARYEQAC